MDFKFGELRKNCYLSKLDRLSICEKETLNYNNFMMLRDVPERYDELYVYGIGLAESEFYRIGECQYDVKGNPDALVLLSCIEVIVSEHPKSFFLVTEGKNR